MKDREKIIRYFQTVGAGDEARRMLDMAEQVIKGRPFCIGNFTSPAGLSIAEAIRANYEQLVIASYGGYERAERIRIAFVDNQYNGPVDFAIIPLAIKWDPRFRLITHRDVLGSLMSLGIERDQLGDIILVGGGAQILVTEGMADYITQHFTKIAMVPVSVTPMEPEDIQTKEERVKEVRTTVPSMRLDAVASSGFSVSRTKLVEAVNAGLIQVNWKPTKGPSQEVKVGDIISMRGRGRMKVEAVTGMSRKGRVGVHLIRYL